MVQAPQELKIKNVLANLHRDNGEICPECKKANIATQLLKDDVNGEMYCRKCGYVDTEKMLERILPRTTEGGYFNQHAGIDKLLGYGKSTMISPSQKDHSGIPLKGANKFKMYGLRKMDSHIEIKRADRNFIIAFQLLERIRSKIKMTDAAVEATQYMYKKRVGLGYTRGRSIKSVLVACAYRACKEHGTPTTPKQLAAIAGINTKLMTREFRLMQWTFNKKLNKNKSQKPAISIVQNPEEFIPAIASRAGISGSSTRRALEILKKLSESFIGGKPRSSLAASALYLACMLNSEKKTEKQIATASGVTTVTIRNMYRKVAAASGLVDFNIIRDRYHANKQQAREPQKIMR